jgi:Group II intron, maturase-specific domain
VYCKDADRRATYANERFDFLGYTFRPRSSKRKAGTYAVNFLPAVSNDAMKAMGQKLRSWRINRRSDKSLDDLAHFCNKVVQGWINYLRTLLQVRVVSTPQTHQHVPRAMGQAEVQAAARPYQTGTALASAHCAPRVDAVCPLAPRAARRLDNGS